MNGFYNCSKTSTWLSKTFLHGNINRKNQSQFKKSTKLSLNKTLLNIRNERDTDEEEEEEGKMICIVLLN